MRGPATDSHAPTSASTRLLAEAQLWTPGGVHSCRRAFPPGLCFQRGHGAYIEDVDGRTYLDFHGAYGPLILGHSNPEVDSAVTKTLSTGVLYGWGTTDAEVSLARTIVNLVPSIESVLFGVTGTDQVANAVRVARAYTGRHLLLKFQGGYSGSSDYLLRNGNSSRALVNRRDPGSAGMLDAAVDSTLVCRWNDLQQLDSLFKRYGDRLAAVVTEPILHNAGSVLPSTGFLERVRSLCTEYATLLIFDEVITYRHHTGGYQAICGVTPDLTVIGKSLGNGYPITALGGRRAVMARFATTPDGDVFYGGTYNASALGVAAALATLAIITREPVHAHVSALGERMRDGLRSIIQRIGYPAHVSGFGSVLSLYFLERDTEFVSYDDVLANDDPMQVAYYLALVERGVFVPPEPHGRYYISLSHTEADVDRALTVAEEALLAVTKHARGRPS